MPAHNLSPLFSEFMAGYDAVAKDDVWRRQSREFRDFWKDRVSVDNGPALSEEECDRIIKLLDRNAKGNTKNSEAVAKAMISQGAWRRMFQEFRGNVELRNAVSAVLEAKGVDERARCIDRLYELNREGRNNLTGPSGNAVGAFLALHDPMQNVSVISLNDRKRLLDFLGVAVPFDWDNASIGQRIAVTGELLLGELRRRGLEGTARTLTRFFYSPFMRPQWKDVDTVRRVDQDVDVVVPASTGSTVSEVADDSGRYAAEIRESLQIQALLSRIGSEMGFSIWLPRADRGGVLKAWKPQGQELLEDLPLGYDSTTKKTIELIDVLWLKRRTIVRAFEVEHTTSVYSGLLRMADLIALQPNLNIKLHIVAPDDRRDKVLQEIKRPVFALLEGCPLAQLCTFLSYKSVRDIADSKLLSHLSDSVLEEYEEAAD